MTRFVTLILGILCFWPVNGQRAGGVLEVTGGYRYQSSKLRH